MGPEKVAVGVAGHTLDAQNGGLSLVPDLGDAAAHLDAGFGGEGPEQLDGLFAMKQHLQTHVDGAHQPPQGAAARDHGIGRQNLRAAAFIDEVQVFRRPPADAQGVEHGVLGGPGLGGGGELQPDEIG